MWTPGGKYGEPEPDASMVVADDPLPGSLTASSSSGRNGGSVNERFPDFFRRWQTELETSVLPFLEVGTRVEAKSTLLPPRFAPCLQLRAQVLRVSYLARSQHQPFLRPQPRGQTRVDPRRAHPHQPGEARRRPLARRSWSRGRPRPCSQSLF